MKNIDREFAKMTQYDMNTSEESVETSVSSVSTREIQNIKDRESVYTTIDIAEQFRIDAKPFINRPFYLGTMDFPTTKARFSLLNCPFAQMPGDILRSNPTLLNGIKMGSLYRSKCKLNISLAGTITHAGTLLVGVIPPAPNAINYGQNQSGLVNTILSGPHAFLHANEATSVTLPVPWYCNSDLASLDMEKTSATYSSSSDAASPVGNYGTLVALVIAPLQPSTGSSTTLAVTVEAIFECLDILVPTPRYVTWVQQSITSVGTKLLDSAASGVKKLAGDAIDGMRAAVKLYTGLHNPQTAALEQAELVVKHNRQNNIDSTQYFETLDPHTHYTRIVEEPIFNTVNDEMDLKSIFSKKQYIGFFRVNSADAVGTRLFARPISPYQGGAKLAFPVQLDTAIINNIEILHYISRAWKGSIKITIQSVMNNKQQVKLRLLQLYNPSTNAAIGYPRYQDILQAPSHLMEFTGGGQEQSVVLPCLSRNKLIPCSRDSVTEGLFHGEYYVYLAQPLANSSGSPNDIYFNVYISLEDDFTFYGYSTERMLCRGPLDNTAALSASNAVSRDFVPQSIEVMNEPQKQTDSINFSRSVDMDTTRLFPIHNIRDYIRRMYMLEFAENTLAAGAEFFRGINIASLFGEISAQDYAIPQLLSRMYYGKVGGVKCRIIVNSGSSTSKLRPMITFLPPNMYVNSANSVISASLVAPAAINKFGITALPIPYTDVPVELNSGYQVFEFTIPNTNIYKYVGGPSKVGYYTNAVSVKDTSTSDMGSLNVSFFNDSGAAFNLKYSFYYGFTDETRFGFHSLAPFMFRPVDSEGLLLTGYSGSFADSSKPPSATANKYLYYNRQ